MGGNKERMNEFPEGRFVKTSYSEVGYKGLYKGNAGRGFHPQVGKCDSIIDPEIMNTQIISCGILNIINLIDF